MQAEVGDRRHPQGPGVGGLPPELKALGVRCCFTRSHSPRTRAHCAAQTAGERPRPPDAEEVAQLPGASPQDSRLQSQGTPGRGPRGGPGLRTDARGVACKDTGVVVIDAAAVQEQGDAVQLAHLQRDDRAGSHTETGRGRAERLQMICFSVLFPPSPL